MKNANRFSFLQNAISFFIVFGKILDVNVYSLHCIDPGQGVFDNGQVFQPQEVHFQEPHVFYGVHFVLGDYGFVVLRRVLQRHYFVQRSVGDHHAAGVGGGVAGNPLQFFCRIDQFSRLFVRFVKSAELRDFFHRFIQSHAERNHLGDAVAVGIGVRHGSSHVSDYGSGGHGSEGDYLRHFIPAVFLGHVLDYFVSPAVREIKVYVGHGDPIRIQKPLKQEVILQRVNVGDVQNVGDDGASDRAAARSHYDPVLLCPVDEILDNEKVGGKTGLFYH